MKGSRRWFFVVLTTAVGAAVVSATVIWITRKYCTIATLDCGHGRSIVLSSETSWEYSPPLYYQVFDGGKEVVPRTFVGYLADLGDRRPYDIFSLDYRLRSAEDGQVVGIVPLQLPYAVIVLHDFNNNESWPRFSGEYDGTQVLRAGRRWQRLRVRLESQNPDISLTAKVADAEYVRSVDFLYFCHSRLTDTDLSKLRGFANIETLHLDDTEITDTGLQHLATLPNLCHLSVANTAVSDEGLRYLVGLKSPGWVDLSGTKVTVDGLKKFKESLQQGVDVWYEVTDKESEHRTTPSR